MSLMMMLEMDRSVGVDLVRQILARCGADVLADNGDEFNGNFQLSNMFFSFFKIQGGRVKAEDFEGDWDVGAEMTFVYVISELERCRKQLRCFLDGLSEVAACNWVLSFQYESVCAFGNASSVHWIKEL
ncbi:hypothetical protein [Burkholderia ubonensis]|uniref:hypothetical protein n=1 Tax=Burkholderia ubonensis TaxID=101571 RepID=UPI0012F7CF1F|nr:hypothetical protein [Burkholderia ubonensis]